MTTREEIIHSINAGVEHVERTYNALSDQELEIPVEVAGREWVSRDILAHLVGRDYIYETIIRMAEFDQMPDTFESGPDHISRQEAHVRMTRDSFDQGGPSLSRRPGTFEGSDPEWEYQASTPQAGKSKDELLSEFRQVHENLVNRVQRLPDELLNKPSPVGDAGDTLADTLKHRSGDFLEDHASRVDEAIAEASR